MNSNRLFLRISFLGISTGIIFGAFGTHVLKEFFSNYELDIWEKGIFYQLINSFGLMVLVLLNKSNFIKNPPFLLLTLGTLLFSFSLYIIALSNAFLETNHIIKTLLIPITPLGGLLLILSWILLLFKIKI